MSDLGLVDAWQLWWQGRSTLGHELWGVSMIWWGRLGQTMAFVSGMTVILDLIGPERLREFGRRFRDADPQNSMPGWLMWSLIGSCFLALGLAQAAWEADRSDSFFAKWEIGLIALVLYALTVVMFSYSTVLVRWFAQVLENRVLERIVRVVALVGLTVGFQFDLLAS